VFQGFSKAKSANGGSILSSSKNDTAPAALKIKLASKVVKVDSKIIIPLPRSKSLKLTVECCESVLKKNYFLRHFFGSTSTKKSLRKTQFHQQ
jgi:hypothetical protein